MKSSRGGISIGDAPGHFNSYSDVTKPQIKRRCRFQIGQKTACRVFRGGERKEGVYGRTDPFHGGCPCRTCTRRKPRGAHGSGTVHLQIKLQSSQSGRLISCCSCCSKRTTSPKTKRCLALISNHIHSLDAFLQVLPKIWVKTQLSLVQQALQHLQVKLCERRQPPPPQ